MRRADFYTLRKGDVITDAETLNKRLIDIDLRLALVEEYGTQIAGAVDALTAVALARLNDTFTPLIIEAQGRLNTLGASFSAESQTSASIIQTGTLALTLTDATAQNYVYTDYVSVRAAANPAAQMLGQVTSFDRVAKLLSLTIVSGEGAGTFNDWLLRVGTPPETGHATRTDNPHAVTAAQLGNPAGSAPAYTRTATDAAIAAAIAAIPGVDLSSRLAKASNLADLPDKAASRVNLGLGALAVLSTVGYGDLAANIPASAANFLANTASKFLTPNAVWAAADWIPLTDAATIAVNLAAGVNFWVTLGGNRILGIPTNVKNCQAGMIYVSQDGAGGRTLGFEAGYKFDSGVVPGIDTTPNSTSILYYFAHNSGSVFLGMPFRGVR